MYRIIKSENDSMKILPDPQDKSFSICYSMPVSNQHSSNSPVASFSITFSNMVHTENYISNKND
uniref:Uncharacterized protein n=1 Tax=Arion vulgaris TaxID=1028688 RepID=A0A0B7BCP3_9EUPU